MHVPAFKEISEGFTKLLPSNASCLGCLFHGISDPAHIPFLSYTTTPYTLDPILTTSSWDKPRQAVTRCAVPALDMLDREHCIAELAPHKVPGKLGLHGQLHASPLLVVPVVARPGVLCHCAIVKPSAQQS